MSLLKMMLNRIPAIADHVRPHAKLIPIKSANLWHTEGTSYKRNTTDIEIITTSCKSVATLCKNLLLISNTPPTTSTLEHRTYDLGIQFNQTN